MSALLALFAVVYLVSAVWVTRMLYGQWRASILNRAQGQLLMPDSQWTFNIPTRIVWAGIVSFFVTLMALPVVCMIMAIMWRPPKSDWEQQQELSDIRREQLLLEHDLEQSRADLARLREERR